MKNAQPLSSTGFAATPSIAPLPVHAHAVSGGPTARRRGRLRSVGAVLVGFLTIVVVSTAVDAVLHATRVYPPYGQSMSHALFALAAAYRFVIAVAGCFLTARLAPQRPMKHALVLGGIGTVISVTGAAAMWGAGPAWYALAVIAMSFPCAWLGARLHARIGGRRSATAG